MYMYTTQQHIDAIIQHTNCIQTDRFQIVKLLINNNADVNRKNAAKNTPLMSAGEAGQFHMFSSNLLNFIIAIDRDT